jgi:hypothetical protein
LKALVRNHFTQGVATEEIPLKVVLQLPLLGSNDRGSILLPAISKKRDVVFTE